MARRLAAAERVLTLPRVCWSPWQRRFTGPEDGFVCRLARRLQGDDYEHSERWAGYCHDDDERVLLASVLAKIEPDEPSYPLALYLLDLAV
jgi:hypothetical protein